MRLWLFQNATGFACGTLAPTLVDRHQTDNKHKTINMKTTILTLSMVTTTILMFGQQPQKKTTLTNKEKIQHAAVNEYGVRVQNENNQMAADALKKLKDTTLSTSERKVYIDNYRKSVRNGNPAIKKKSFDLTTEETLAEYTELSKSQKFNKKTQQTCLQMRQEIITQIERQKAIALNPLADENSDDFRALQDTSYDMGWGNRKQHIEGYIVFKCNVNPAPREKQLIMLQEMSTSPKFNKATQALCLELYNKYNK